MILGIVAMASFCVPYAPILPAVVGLILSILGKKDAAVSGVGGGMAMTGMILSIIALGLALLFLILAASVFAIFRQTIPDMEPVQSSLQYLAQLIA